MRLMISYSHKDQLIANALIAAFKKSYVIPDEDLFCSGHPEYGATYGTDINKKNRELPCSALRTDSNILLQQSKRPLGSCRARCGLGA